MTWRGGCTAFQKFAGFPPPEGGCCSSCQSEEEYGIQGIEADGYDLRAAGFDISADDFFSICCSCKRAYDEFIESRGAA